MPDLQFFHIFHTGKRGDGELRAVIGQNPDVDRNVCHCQIIDRIFRSVECKVDLISSLSHRKGWVFPQKAGFQSHIAQGIPIDRRFFPGFQVIGDRLSDFKGHDRC